MKKIRIFIALLIVFCTHQTRVNKSITNKWSVNMEINRRDGGRTGWNGSLEVKYNF